MILSTFIQSISKMNSVGVKYGGFCRVLYVVCLGQLTSFSMALMSFNSSLSANLGVNAPFTLSFFSYLALTLVFGSILLYRRQKLQISWYWYVLIAFVDVQGNYLVNKAYQFSSITSVTLLDCWTVVWVIILTWLFLGTKYSLWQFFGAALCVTGLCLVLLSDSGVGGGGLYLRGRILNLYPGLQKLWTGYTTCPFYSLVSVLSYTQKRKSYSRMASIISDKYSNELPKLEDGDTDQLSRLLPEEAVRAKKFSVRQNLGVCLGRDVVQRKASVEPTGRLIVSSTMTKLDVNHGGFWRVLYVLLLGQLASFSLAFMSFNSSLSANLGVNAPFTLAFFSYLAVTSVFGSILLYRRQKLHISWYWYVLLAVADVQGGYLVNKAYQFSSITSVTILDCATVVWVIILTWLFLGTKYSLWQFLGAALCVTGLCLVLLSDSEVGGGGGSNPILGDILVIAGTCCFALTNVSEASGATLFNLSLLTADMWAVAIRVLLYRQKFIQRNATCGSSAIYSTCNTTISYNRNTDNPLKSVHPNDTLTIKILSFWFGVFKKSDSTALIDIMGSSISRVGVKYMGLWRVFYAVLLGQFTSFSMAVMCFNSSLSANLGVNAPFTLSFFAYLAMTLVFGSILLYRRQKPHISWYWYVLLAFVDVQGSYLVNTSYQFSSVTSVTLLDCTTVVWVILLTWIFLGTKYSIWQFFGAALCVTGLCLVLLSDSGVGGGGGSNPILGDVLVIAATCFFAFSNVGEEFCVKKILTFAGYGIAGFMYYSLTPLVLQASGATLFNLSLLTADMWAVVIRVFLYHQKVDWLYYVSFLLVGIGLVIYSKPLDVNYVGFWRVLYVVLLGQLASFSVALMSFNSSLSANLGVNAPFTLAFFSYLAVTLVFGSILLCGLQISWSWYALLAFVDVQGTYLFNKAYQFSSITSVMILDCCTIVWVIILTWIFLGTKYSIRQFLGAALCVTGLCLVLLSDSEVGGGGGSNPILGDVLVIAGTCFFALSNVGEEFCVEKVGQIEVIAMFGLFGMLLSVVEMYPFLFKVGLKFLFLRKLPEGQMSVFHNHPLGPYLRRRISNLYPGLRKLLYVLFFDASRSTGKWSHAIQSVITDGRYVGSGHSCVPIPPEGGWVILRIIFTRWYRSRHIFKTVSLVSERELVYIYIYTETKRYE
ncbi:Protein of unknown function DUF914, eukaryotic [Cynara cardunculus var. scolymus]|uniref:Drug/metabolite transporter n=1 Tax=Cynara cardunculus var. scolymus TaxID=59895 RepID=A0A103YF26_CYNCS|nr:Protein of unknown function DUF914, eukaryotic [Cynara cardunculus var. scolymus]